MITDLPEKISPEGLRVAETYLIQGDIDSTANSLAMTSQEVSDTLRTREVKAYIDHQYLESGYRNRNKIAAALDEVIEMKLLEMEESEMGSTKDIADLLQMAHKMRMEELKAMQDNDKQSSNTNILVADTGGKNYNKLLGQIYNAKS